MYTHNFFFADFVFVFHVKIFFTFANSIYETIFAQHIVSQLFLEGPAIGWMLGYVGLATTFSNTIVVHRYGYIIKKYHGALVLTIIIHAFGLLWWSVATHVGHSMIASAIIAITNNVIINYFQTEIALRTSKSNKGEILGYSQSMERAARTGGYFITTF